MVGFLGGSGAVIEREQSPGCVREQLCDLCEY